jgi:branched-chain amino acid transport system permease protein
LWLLIGVLFLAALAVTWDFFTGLSGYFNFGHMVLVGIGGYSSVLLEHEIGISIWLAILLASVLTAVAGTLLLAAPSLRLSGIYFSAITLIVFIWAENVVVLFRDLTGGRSGHLFVSSLGPEVQSLVPFDISTRLLLYYTAALNFLLIVAVFVLLSKFKLGKVLVAIRQDEDLVATLGLSPTRFKIIAFFSMSFFVGLTGALWTHSITTLAPSTQLSLSTMIDILVATIIGGFGTVVGPVLGVIILEGSDHVLTEIHKLGLLSDTFGIDIREFSESIWITIALIMMFVYPEGLYPRIRAGLDSIDSYLGGLVND